MNFTNFVNFKLQ